MLPLRLFTFTCVSVLTGPACVLAFTTQTVVGVAGRRVTLPCRSEALMQRGVGMCWGRGEPTLFTCQDTLIKASADQLTYRKSYRYSVSSLSGGGSSLSILNSRLSDSGFYHCRVERPGLFNDQTFIVHLIIITPRSVASDWSTTETSELSSNGDAGNLNAPHTTTTGYSRGDVTEDSGSDDVTGYTEGPVVAPVQSRVQQTNNLEVFIGHTLRLSFIVFIPPLLLMVLYKVWGSNQRARAHWTLNQSEEEEEDSSV